MITKWCIESTFLQKGNKKSQIYHKQLHRVHLATGRKSKKNHKKLHREPCNMQELKKSTNCITKSCIEYTLLQAEIKYHNLFIAKSIIEYTPHYTMPMWRLKSCKILSSICLEYTLLQTGIKSRKIYHKKLHRVHHATLGIKTH